METRVFHLDTNGGRVTDGNWLLSHFRGSNTLYHLSTVLRNLEGRLGSSCVAVRNPAQSLFPGHCPAGQTLRPSGIDTRNRAIRYRTSACTSCALKQRCTPGAQRTIHRLVDQSSLDRMEARIHANPSLMTIRRCTVEHPFGTIKRMSGGGRFLTRGLRAVKAEAALSILAFNILHAANAFGTKAITPS